MLKRRQPGYRVLAVLCSIATLPQSTCRRDESVPPTGESVAEPAAEKPSAGLLVFPDSMHVEDASVNAFLQRAMNTCTGGEYEAFRLLWSAREDPLTRAEFETGWQAVREIRIRALERVLFADNDSTDQAGEKRPAYAVFAEVQLDPNLPAGQREADREVVLMIVRERDAWRLGHAPKSMRVWLKERVGGGRSSPDNLEDEPPGEQPG